MNKNGKGNGMIWFAVILVLVLVGGFFMVNQSVSENPNVVNGQVLCENEPYIDNSTFDFYLRGTSVAASYYWVDKADFDAGTGQAQALVTGSSGTKFKVGDKIVIFTSASDYIDSVEDFTISACGSNKFQNYLKNSASGAAVLDILDESTKVSDAADASSAVNITGAASAGLSVSYTVRVDGITDDSSGELLLTIEGNDTELSDIELTTKSGAAKIIGDGDTSLKLFSAEGTAPTFKAAFLIGPVEDGERAEYTVKLISETSATIGAGTTTGFLYHNLYAAQWFIDDDGSLQYGFEDSDGTLKYENKYTDHDALVV